MRTPCAHGVPKKEARDKDRRLDEKGQHGIRPVIAPATSSSPRCDGIMILNAILYHLRKPWCDKTAVEMVKQVPFAILRDSLLGKNSKPKLPEARAIDGQSSDCRASIPVFHGLTLLPPPAVADRRPPGTPRQPVSVNAIGRFPSGLL